MTRARNLKVSVLAAVAASVLSGCGLHPGAAAVVGGDEITNAHVDAVAAALCSANTGGQNGQPLASRGARQGALQVLLDSDLSQQFGRAKGVQPDQKQVSQAIARNQSSIDVLPAGQRDDFRSALQGYAEGQLMLIAVGHQYLADQGTPTTDDNKALAAGRKLRAKFAKGLDIQVDPRYGSFDAAKGTVQTSGGSLSVPASSSAADGASPDPSAGWVAALPATQKCS